ncbi:hypothetical protein BTO02_11685 [Paraburkholderia sp. SOS3]|nr:hypothetical protein BTO02_11685 [Paraburkholderia sp. SOS3]
MSWPIPTLATIERPQPVSARVWLPALLVVAAATAAAVLTMWPHDRSTHTTAFWALLIGAPVCACGLLFGWRLNAWEQQQLIAEESEREKQRLESLWRDWCRRCLPVVHAAAFLPRSIDAASLRDRDAMLPVNTNRATGFDWAKGKTAAERRSALLARIAARFEDRLSACREFTLTLILDEASLAEEAAWQAEARRMFERTVPGVEFEVDMATATDCAEWIEQYIDVDELPARLIVAAQLWSGDGGQAFSEGAAAILFGSRANGYGREGAPIAPAAGYVLRPMTTGDETLKADLAQLMEMQLTTERLTHVWFTGCGDAFEVATTASLSSPETRIVERLVDSFIGLPGPVSGWIALSLALEAGESIRDSQLIACRQAGAQPARLCVVAPGEFEDN